MAKKDAQAAKANGGTNPATPAGEQPAGNPGGALARIGGGAAGALARVDIGDWSLAHLSELGDGADMREVLAENVGGANLSAFDFTRIKVPAGGGIAWEIANGETGEVTTANAFDCIVTAWNDQKAYWAKGLDDKDAVSGPPDCFSLDTIKGNGNPGILCANCKFNNFGTAKGGSARGKACKDTRLLFVNMPGDVLPQLVIVPPTSLKNVKAYFLRLAARGVPYWRAVTRLKLVRDKNAQGIQYAKVAPECVGVLQGEQAAAVSGYAATIKAMLGKATVQVRRLDLEPDAGNVPTEAGGGGSGGGFAGEREYVDGNTGDAGADEDRAAQVV